MAATIRYKMPTVIGGSSRVEVDAEPQAATPVGAARLRRFNLDGVVTCCRAYAARVRGLTSSVRSQ